MALDFGGVIDSERDRFEIVGPQFESESTAAKLINYVFTSNSPETVYTVPAGKTLFITKFIMSNTDTDDNQWTVSCGAATVFQGSVGNSETVAVDFDSPIVLTTGLSWTADSNDSNSSMSLIGWEQ